LEADKSKIGAQKAEYMGLKAVKHGIWLKNGDYDLELQELQGHRETHVSKLG